RPRASLAPPRATASNAGSVRAGEAALDLRLDPRDIGLLGFEVQRSLPLEASLLPSPDFPVGVAEMVVDHRVGRIELDRPLQMLDRLLIVAEPVEHPAQAIDDVAILRPEVDRAPQHVEGAVIVLALLDPGIGEIVHHVRMLGLELQRLQEIRLGQLPTAAALMCDAAEVKDRPVLGPEFI